MKLLLSLAIGLFGFGLLLTSGSTPAALATAELATITTGSESDGNVEPEPVPAYRICTADAGNCTDCVAGIKCEKDLKLRLCKPTEKVSKCSLSVKTACGKGKLYSNLDCTGTVLATGDCSQGSCP